MVTDFANEKQINDYMLLALHLLQRMRRLLSVEDFELDERFTKALYMRERGGNVKAAGRDSWELKICMNN